jgi:hypothetical protein
MYPAKYPLNPISMCSFFLNRNKSGLTLSPHVMLCDHEVNINAINRKEEYIIIHDAIFVMFLLFFVLAAVMSSIDAQNMMNVYT